MDLKVSPAKTVFHDVHKHQVHYDFTLTQASLQQNHPVQETRLHQAVIGNMFGLSSPPSSPLCERCQVITQRGTFLVPGIYCVRSPTESRESVSLCRSRVALQTLHYAMGKSLTSHIHQHFNHSVVRLKTWGICTRLLLNLRVISTDMSIIGFMHNKKALRK